MRSGSLVDIYHWGIRSALYGQGPKELSAPWYDINQQRNFEQGRKKGKHLAMTALVTGEDKHAIIKRWGDDGKYFE